jgi:hypothetical protein
VSPSLPADLETDPRFVSGPWTGFFLQRELPDGRYQMELILTFCRGRITGEGRDLVGAFVVDGSYSLPEGKCRWTKRYLGKHDVYYQGFNEGKGIWGTWEIPPRGAFARLHGGFHIWPEGMSDPTTSHLAEEAELPAPMLEEVGAGANADPVPVGIGTQSP